MQTNNPYTANFRSFTAIAMIAAPILMALSTLMWEAGVVSNASGVLMQYAFFCWILAFLVLFRKLADVMPRYAVYGLAIAILGCFAGNNFGQEGLYINTFNLDPLETREAINAQPAFILTLFLPGAMFPLSIVVLGFMLLRHKRVSTWVAIMMILGAIAFPMSRIPRVMPIGIVADLILAAPLLYLGMKRLKAEEAPEVSAQIA